MTFGFNTPVLRHSPFSLLKDMFPLQFNNVDVNNLHCDICEFAKHHHVSFPLSNTRSSYPFSLIHSDIWGPSKIPNILGVEWFVSFIDCTRVTWAFLLKQKFEASEVFPNFFKTIKTNLGYALRV